MRGLLDIALVSAAVVGAICYFAFRRWRRPRAANRDWSTGRAETCSSCPVVEVRKVQLQKQLPTR